jgi:ribosomal protein S12 methylthiotransferase
MVSLGCPKNFVDTEVMAGVLVSNGFGLTFAPEEAEYYLVNTCAFIPPARDEARDNLEAAIEWKKEMGGNSKVIVTGCLIQWDRLETFHKEYPEVDAWIGIDEVPNIAGILKDLKSGKQKGDRYLCQVKPEFIYNEKIPRLQLTLPHIAYLKIAEGCSNRCSYCSIPNIRGDLRSRNISSIITEAKNLLENGVRELLLIGQDITAFGNDNDSGETLAQLIKELDKFEGDYWVRLLYTHPAHFTDTLIDALAESKHALPYIDMPLQHISDNILQSMRRKVDGQHVRALLKKLRERIPDISVRTTFITGYPGETEENFNELKQFITEQKFERLGVFSYYPEPGTPAAELQQVPKEIGEARAAELMELQAKISLKLNNQLVGKQFDVIVDFVDNDIAVGRTRMDAPEIDNNVAITDAQNVEPGEFHKVVITDADEYDLVAKTV